MEKLNLRDMPLDDLWALHERISKFLSERIIAEKHALEAQLRRLNRGGSGPVPVAEEPGSRHPREGRRRRKYPEVLPKYQNSKAPFETWSGRGKRPRWLVSALRAGSKVEDFEIPAPLRAKHKTKSTGQPGRD